MGNANCTVYNDTPKEILIYVFSYANGMRTSPREQFYLKPGESRKAEALPHGSGLIIATGLGPKGHHTSVENGKTLKVSELLTKPGNGWYDVTVGATVIGVTVACTATGGAAGAAIVGYGGGVAATGCSIGTGCTVGATVGVAGSTAWYCSIHVDKSSCDCSKKD